MRSRLLVATLGAVVLPGCLVPSGRARVTFVAAREPAPVEAPPEPAPVNVAPEPVPLEVTLDVELSYTFFPEHNAYFCESTDEWWVVEAGGWTRMRARPRSIVITRETPWVVVNIRGPAPQVRFEETARIYPRHWRPERSKGPPPGRGWDRHDDGGRAPVLVAVDVEVGYVYFPEHHVYFCESTDEWWVVEAGGWTRTRTRPRTVVITRETPWVAVNIRGPAPQVRLEEHARAHPRNWKPERSKGPPPGRGWDRRDDDDRARRDDAAARAEERAADEKRVDEARRARAEKRVADAERARAEKKADDEEDARVEKRADDERRARAEKRADDAKRARDDRRTEAEKRAEEEKDALAEKRADDEKRARAEKRAAGEKRAEAGRKADDERHARDEKQADDEKGARDGKRARAEKRADDRKRAREDRRPEAEKRADEEKRAKNDKRTDAEKRLDEEEAAEEERAEKEKGSGDGKRGKGGKDGKDE